MLKYTLEEKFEKYYTMLLLKTNINWISYGPY